MVQVPELNYVLVYRLEVATGTKYSTSSTTKFIVGQLTS